jgi:hypothetical protein
MQSQRSQTETDDGKAEETVDDDASLANTPMGHFRHLARRLLKVPRAELEDERERYRHAKIIERSRGSKRS